MKRPFVFFIALSILVIADSSCKKDTFITSSDARLRINADSIKFDTVFTTTGSITKSFKIVNENNQPLQLSSVKLMGASSSAFKININGTSATELINIKIEAEDSIYVFVSVTINPTIAGLPFIISDSISVQFNGNQRWVQLEAYGQNAHFKNNIIINSNTTWNNDLPFVILGSLTVAEDVSLTLNEGVKIYTHADAPILIDGTLIVNGNINNKVIFTGDRLDEPYLNFPSSWPGIFFRSSSKNNFLQFAEIKNAYQAMVVIGPSPNANPKVVIQQCILDNSFNTGLFCSNTSVQASNTLISNCANNISIELGGDYLFNFCIAASYSNNFILHKSPVLSVANFSTLDSNPATNNLQANFNNCIFWGDNGFVDNEVLVNKKGNNPFNVTLSNCIFKAVNDPPYTNFIAVIKNEDPLFDSIDVGARYYNFRQNNNPLAPGTNKGAPTTILKDLDNNSRSVGIPDIGCYEKQ